MKTCAATNIGNCEYRVVGTPSICSYAFYCDYQLPKITNVLCLPLREYCPFCGNKLE